MKIWVTRSCASSILFGGLERLFIWFRKPIYVCELITDKYRDSPFGDLSETQYPYYRKIGWEQDTQTRTMWTGESSPLSFGKIFGYCDDDNENYDLSSLVWEKLCEHFNNLPFDQWEKYEKNGFVKESDFLLEIDLDIKIKS